MLLLLVFIRNFEHLSSYNDKIRIDKESEPSFVEAMFMNNTIIDSKFNLEVTISTQYSNTQREFYYYRSSLTITGKSSFINNYAFGSSRSTDSGGAIFLCQSLLTISLYSDPENLGVSHPVKFAINEAAVGGAIALFASPSLIYATEFKANKAYKFGGGIYFQGIFTDFNGQSQTYLAPEIKMVLARCKFADNIAFEIGGAISISYAIEIYVEQTRFMQNKCSFGGGAIHAANCDDMKVVKCQFAYNIVNANNLETHLPTKMRKLFHNEHIDNTFSNTKIANHEKARGGGAICFYSDSYKGSLPTATQSFLQRHFISEYNCYYKDSAMFSGGSYGDGAGHEILLEGYSKWFSWNDFVWGYKKECYIENEVSQYVSKVYHTWPMNASSWQVWEFRGGSSFNMTGLDQCVNIESGITDPEPTHPSETLPSFAPINNTENCTTVNVPAPTTFIYQATPITNLPFPTTRSHITPLSFSVHPNMTQFFTSLSMMPGMKSYTSMPDMPDHTPFPTPPPTTPPPTLKPTPEASAPIAYVSNVSTNNGPVFINDNEKKKKSNAWIFGLVALLVLLGVVAFCIYYFVINREQEEEEETDDPIQMEEETVMTIGAQEDNSDFLPERSDLWLQNINKDGPSIVKVEDMFDDDFTNPVISSGIFSSGPIKPPTSVDQSVMVEDMFEDDFNNSDHEEKAISRFDDKWVDEF